MVDWAKHFFQIGLNLSIQRRYSDAVISYDKSIAINSNNAKVWHNRGVALDNLGQYLEAIASYDKALAIKPDYIYARISREVASDKLDRYREARTSYDKSSKVILTSSGKNKKPRKRKEFEPKRIPNSVCTILKSHSEELKNDPNHLKSDYLVPFILGHDQLYNEIVKWISTDQTDIIMNKEILAGIFELDLIFQKRIIELCGQTKNFTSLLLLGKFLSSKFQENQVLATKILNEIGTEKAFEQLMLGYHIKIIHPTIKFSLKEHGLTGIESLIKFAQNRNPVIRFNSMIALGEMGETALEPLLQCLTDDNVVLRRVAANALGDFGNVNVLKSLINAQEDPDDEVKKLSKESCSLIIRNLGFQGFIDLINSNIS
ncbi:HEAT repeat domain-containing protein [Methanoregula sp.]|uniref:HEAT repeat domain-containing protein n=1 Tax=Methanoregula sp. TaxID=2052170 RepID=UPI003C3C41A1